MFGGAYAIRPYPGRASVRAPLRSFGPGGPFGGAYAVSPRGPVWGAYAVAPRVSPRAMIRRPVRPPRVRAFVTVIRARGPVWWGVFNAPLHGYVHSGPFGYPAKFAGVRRRPGQIRRPPQGPILPGDGCRDCRRRRRAFRVSYRPRPASWDSSASRHRASSAPSVPWAASGLWDPWAA